MLATRSPEPVAPGHGSSVRARRRIQDLALVGAVALALAVLFAVPVIVNGPAFPVGPDVPVYLWWARVAASEGVPAVGARPGVPVLLPTLGGALGLGPVAALAGLQYALGPTIGLAGAALIRGRGGIGRPAWVVAGLFAGVWATHLGDGYVANLVFVAAYLAAAAMLARRTRRTAVAAAILLGGGGLAHPQFFVVGAAILVIAAAWSGFRDRAWSWSSDAGRTVAAVAGGGAIVGVGLVAALGGPPRIDGDTSKDAFLRRTERWGALRRTYRSRFEHNWRRYAPIMSSVLIVMGTLQGRGFARRFLVTWIVVTLVALPVGIVTAWFPPDRILTFAFCIPLLAALGFVWLGRRLGRWWIAWPICIAVWVLMILAPFRVWAETSAFVSATEMRAAVAAGRIAATTPAGTVLVFVANDPRSGSLFLASHVLNVARAAVPPDRADDVAVFVGSVGDLLEGRPTARGDALFDLASATSLEELPDDRPFEIFVVSELDRDPADLQDPRLIRWPDDVATTVEDPRPLAAVDGEPLGISTGATLVATVATLLLLAAVGGGWAWWAGGDLPSILLAAPAFGVSILTAVALLLERLGTSVGSRPGGLVAVAASAGVGYGLGLRRDRHRREEHRRRQLVLEGEAERQP